MEAPAPAAMPPGLFETVANYTYDWESWLDPEGRPRWINPAVVRMTGYSVADCFAMTDYPLPLVHPDDRPAMRRTLAAAAAGGSGNDVAFRICHRDGRVLWGAMSWQSLYDEAGRRLGTRTSVRDTTARKETEAEQARARAAAEEANRAKSRFLAAASHDLRQPIQAAALFLAALRQRVEGAELLTLVSQLGQCLGQTQALLDQLLDMSRLDAQLLRVEPREVALGDLLERLELEFAGPAAERGLGLRIAATSLFVTADPLLLFRILQNLVANGLRYTERGKVLVGVRRRGLRARISVYDSGIGIPADKQEVIFEEFQQLANPARDRTRGLGLGLAIVKRLAGLMGLPLGLESAPGRGSHFWIEAPLAEELPAEAVPPGAAVEPEAASGRPRLRGRHVALLEDEPGLLAALQTFLAGEGARVTGAPALEELLALLPADRPPEALVVDYRLGQRTGVEDAAALAAALGRPLPTVILTGDTEAQRLLEAEASGHRLLHKPVEPERLAAVLSEMLAAD